jgi:hypothetical protein
MNSDIKIHVNTFYTNDKTKTFDDYIQKIKVGRPCNGVINVWLKTAAKYYNIETGGSSLGPLSGALVVIAPIIYEGDQDLSELDFDEYLNHPDYFHINLVIEAEGILDTTNVVTPLRHEYMITYIDDKYALDYDCLEDAEIIEYEEATW